MRVCKKTDPESKGKVENLVGFVKSSFFSARTFESFEECGSDINKADKVVNLPAGTDLSIPHNHEGQVKIVLVHLPLNPGKGGTVVGSYHNQGVFKLTHILQDIEHTAQGFPVNPMWYPARSSRSGYTSSFSGQ